MRRPSALLGVTAVVFAFLYAPIGVVIVNAFNADRTLTGFGGVTDRWFRQAFTDPAVWV